MKNKQQIVTGVLITLIVVLMVSIFFISKVLLGDNGSSDQASAIAPVKTKAATRTYSKLLAINETPEPTTADVSQTSPTPTIAASSNTSKNTTTTPGVSPTLPPGVSPSVAPSGVNPSPTETVLAYQSLSPTVASASSDTGMSPTTDISATGVQTLPQTGYINNTLILFAVSSLFIFVAFLF